MGVRGLATFFSENSRGYFKPYELCNTYLVVDGNNLASYLYRNSTKSYSAFGGDYDEYYKTVYEFFNLLKDCGVTPIVLFDGGIEKKKLKTKLSRSVSYLYNLKDFAKGFCSSTFFPIFMKQIFMDVMLDMNIICIQCEFEADTEIATVARTLNCPVLSYDSDFFILDVLYIPLPTVQVKRVQYFHSKQCYIKCSIFDINSFLNEFPGLDKGHLPIIATLLGNDYINSSVLEKFFNHVAMPKSKKLSKGQRKIQGMLNWLKKESVESATNLILSHVEKKKLVKAVQAIKTNISYYTNDFVSEGVLDKLRDKLGDIPQFKKKNFNLDMPNKVIQLYSECKIDKLIIDMVCLNIYFTYIQIENIYYCSSHIPALPLIKSLYTLLIPYMEKPNPLKLYLVVKNQYSLVKVPNDFDSILNQVHLDDILKESKEERLKWLCSILGIDDIHLNLLSANYWSLFLMSFIHWTKQIKDISSVHVHALVLMVIANQVVQKFVGYYRTYSDFMKGKGAELNRLKNTALIIGKPATFNEMLKCATLYEKLYIYSVLLPYRQATEKGVGKAYDISIIHLFNCFQSCLFHVMQLNALLNYPLPHIKVSDFYSGTLLFNFYLIVKSKPKFGENLFKETPNLARIYTYLYTSLCKFLTEAIPEVRKRKKKKRKNKEEVEEVICYEKSDDEKDIDYMGENNRYAILKNLNE